MAITSKIMTLSGANAGEKVFNGLKDCGFLWDAVTNWDGAAGTLKKYADESGSKWVGFTVNGTANPYLTIVTSACTTSNYKNSIVSDASTSAAVSYNTSNLMITFTSDTGFPNETLDASFCLFVGTAKNKKTGEKTMMAGGCNIYQSGGTTTDYYLHLGHCAVDSETPISALHLRVIQPLYIDRLSPYLVTRDITGFTDSVADSVRLIIADTEAYGMRSEWIELDGKEYYRNGLFLMEE